MQVIIKVMQRQKRKKDLERNKPKSHLDSTFRAGKIPIRVAHKKHTGQRLPFYCTSYAALFFLLAFTSSLVLLVANTVSADQQSGIVQLAGQVKGKPPEVAAKITYPSNSARFTKSETEVRGTCQQDMYVELYRNNIFSGMTVCGDDGRFSINITLAPGENILKARTRDSLGQYGLDSREIRVFYDLKLASVGIKEGSKVKPLFVYTSPTQRGVLAGQPLSIDYEIDGGEPPYTVAIDWGDSSSVTLLNHKKSGNYATSHIFNEAGQKTVRISVIGSNDDKATIQTIVVVHPINAPISSVSDCNNGVGASFAE